MAHEHREDETLYIITRTNTGFMSSDREEPIKVFGPASKAACEAQLTSWTAYDGPGSNSGYSIVPFRRAIIDRW